MKKLLIINVLALLIMGMAASCELLDNYDGGDGSPSPENIVRTKKYEFAYNRSGLVEKINQVDHIYDDKGDFVRDEIRLLAEISYPSYNRAVMKYHNFSDIIKYTFSFGDNGFAYKIQESYPDGDKYTYKLKYDDEGHLTKFVDLTEYVLFEWTDGNCTKITDRSPDGRGSHCVLTYGGGDGDFNLYGLSPFYFGVNLGPMQNSMEWWFDCGLEYAAYVGFIGRPSKSLPHTITSYDMVNGWGEPYVFVYDSYYGWKLELESSLSN